MPTPSIGRIVHYVAYGTPGGEYKPEHRAAIITGTYVVKVSESNSQQTEEVSLCVLNPTGMFFNHMVPHDEETKKGGTWHWPEMV